MDEIKTFLEQWNDNRDYITAHTSGSTGTPKEIRLFKHDMRLSARATNAFFGIDSSSVLALPLSTAYIAGKMVVVRALEAGCRILPLEISRDITISSPVHLLPIVPAQIASLLDHPEYAAMVRNVLIGGASPAEDDCRNLHNAGYKVHISYGMTETCSHVALADGSDPQRHFHAMPGVSFATTPEGRLIIRRPQYIAAEILTTDIVDLLDDTTFRWRGRADNVINSGGIKLFPEELEQEYGRALPGIAYFVTSVPHAVWGSAVALVVEADSDISASVMEALRSAGVPHRHLPKEVRVVRSISRTPNGKIIRK